MTNHFSTQAVHAGEEKRKPYGALTTPIVQTSTYAFENTAEILDFMHRKQPATLFSLDREERLEAGIKDNLVRYALGIEDVEDLIADLNQALSGI